MYYCDRMCQKRHWREHKNVCSKVEKTFYHVSDIPSEWQENITLSPLTYPLWIMHQARELRISPEHANLIIGIAVPDHPAIRLYMDHPRTKTCVSVPLIPSSIADFEKLYGEKVLNDTLASLRDVGKPSPIWTGKVSSKIFTFEVIGLSGERSSEYSCNHAHTVTHLKDMVASWVLRNTTDPSVVSFELLDGDRVLCDSQTCSEAGLRDGIVLTACKYFDPLPPLICSDSDDD